MTDWLEIRPGLGRYTAEFSLDEDGRHWLARIREIPSCHTYGRNLRQAQRRLREALRLFVADADTAELALDVQLPDEIQRHVSAARSARERATAAQARALEETCRAALGLVDQAGLSVRDAGDLLGLSHQRVQQLIAERRP